jgi:hypothetical protein
MVDNISVTPQTFTKPIIRESLIKNFHLNFHLEEMKSDDGVTKAGIADKIIERLEKGKEKYTEEDVFKAASLVYSFDSQKIGGKTIAQNRQIAYAIDALDGDVNVDYQKQQDISKAVWQSLNGVDKSSVNFDLKQKGLDQKAMGQYLINPLQDKDLSSLTPEQEKKLVQEVFNRANELGDKIVKSIDSDDLRAKTLQNLTSNLTTVVNDYFEQLPSFKGKNDNEKILAEKFGLVYNVTNGDFIYDKITYKDLTSKKEYYAAPRADEITKYNPFVEITASEKVPEDVKKSVSGFFRKVDSMSFDKIDIFDKINIVDDPSMASRGSNISTQGGSNIPLINPRNIAKVAENQGITDPNQIKVIKNGIIANELAHSAMDRLFGDNLTSDKSFFVNYSDPFYKSMNNHQFNELISDVVTAQTNSRDAIVSALRTNEDGYKYTDLTAKRYLEGKGFTKQEIKDIESAEDNQRQSLLESLAKNKNLEIEELSNGFKDYLLELGNNLIKHAQTQNTKK